MIVPARFGRPRLVTCSTLSKDIKMQCIPWLLTYHSETVSRQAHSIKLQSYGTQIQAPACILLLDIRTRLSQYHLIPIKAYSLLGQWTKLPNSGTWKLANNTQLSRVMKVRSFPWTLTQMVIRFWLDPSTALLLYGIQDSGNQFKFLLATQERFQPLSSNLEVISAVRPQSIKHAGYGISVLVNAWQSWKDTLTRF